MPRTQASCHSQGHAGGIERLSVQIGEVKDEVSALVNQPSDERTHGKFPVMARGKDGRGASVNEWPGGSTAVSRRSGLSETAVQS